MTVKLSQQGLFTKLDPKSHCSTIIWISFLALILIPALACNLPPRQHGGLTFPNNQGQTTLPDLPFPTNETTSLPAWPETPTSPTGSNAPSQSPNPFLGLQTATPGPGLAGSWLTPDPGGILPPVTYWTQPGDTLAALTLRFGVNSDQITPCSTDYRLIVSLGSNSPSPTCWGRRLIPALCCRTAPSLYSPEAASFPD